MCIDIYNSIKMTKNTNIKNNELMKRLVNGDKDLQKQMSTRMVIRLNLIEIIGLRSRGIKLKDIAALYLANDKPLNVKTLSQYLWELRSNHTVKSAKVGVITAQEVSAALEPLVKSKLTTGSSKKQIRLACDQLNLVSIVSKILCKI